MELYGHQSRFLNQHVDKALLCWDTGTGKTLTACLWGQETSNCLIICPKALKENWHRETGKHFKKGIPWSVMILTKEEFRRDWETLPAFQSIVVDEAHHFAGMKSQMSKSLLKYLKKNGTERVLLLTATPYRSSPWDIFQLAKYLGRNWNWYKFFDRFFTEIYVGRGKKVPKVKEGIEDDIAELVAGIGDIVKLEDCADVPEQVFETEVLKLTPLQESMKKEAYDANPIVRFTKHHEIENGCLKEASVDGTLNMQDVIIPCDKNDRLVQLCEDNDKTIIVCRYKLQLRALENVLTKIGKPMFLISGDVKNRDEVVRSAEAARQAIVLVQAATSEGYELPSFPLMVFASLDFSYVNYKQMLGRILRINKLKKNVYLHLVSGPIDTAVFSAIMAKKDFDIAIYARDHDEDQVSGEGLSD